MKHNESFEFAFNKLSNQVNNKDLKDINKDEFEQNVKQCVLLFRTFDNISDMIVIRNKLIEQNSNLCYMIPTLTTLCIKLLRRRIRVYDKFKAIESLSLNLLNELIDLYNKNFDIEYIENIIKIQYNSFKDYIDSFNDIVIITNIIIDKINKDIISEIDVIKEIEKTRDETIHETLHGSSFNDIPHETLNESSFNDIPHETLNELSFNEPPFNEITYEMNDDDLNRMQNDIQSNLDTSVEKELESKIIKESMSRESKLKIFLLNLFIDRCVELIKKSNNKNKLMNTVRINVYHKGLRDMLISIILKRFM